MTYLNCGDNNLSVLDLSNNTALTYLDCSINDLTVLDLHNNTALTYIASFNNQLDYLNVKNGNNHTFTYFDCQGNPNLTCVQVDDVVYAIANWSLYIDRGASFSENCPTGIHSLENKNRKIEVYPNPTDGLIHFSPPASVEVRNILGQVIVARDNVQTLDISTQPTNIYFLFILDKNNQIVQRVKIVKE